MARKHKFEHDVVVSTGSAAAVPSRRKSVRRGALAVTPVNEPSDSVNTEIAAAPVPAAFYGPSREDIARLAYSYWEARGCQGGSPEEDWARAEREIGAR
jgi:hypothetical protein